MGPMALLIVSFQIVQLHASTDAPQLKATPKSQYYMSGGSVTLTCSLQHRYSKAKRFTFFKDKTELSSSEWTGKNEESYCIPQLNVSNTGEYSCKYCTEYIQRPVHSLESNPVRITVLEQPRLPFFSVSPKQEVYSSGESVNLKCSVSDTRKVSKILFYKNKTQLGFLEPSSFRFALSLHLFLQDGGNYSCRYWIVDSESEIPSQESNTIGISVTDPPPRPVLKVDPPSGQVNEGDRLLITCSTERNNSEKKFHFYRGGVEMTSTNKELLWSSREPGDASPDAWVTIRQAKPSQTGEFACSYEEKTSSRWIRSHWSQKVNITVLVPPSKVPLEYAAVAISLPIFMVLLVVYCRRKKKEASKCRRESQLTESKEEIDLDYLGILKPRAAALQEQEGSEVTYADVRFCPAGIPGKPVKKNRFKSTEEEGVLYSRVHFQPTSRAAK